MADGFIVRKGGAAASQTAQPTITFVSSTTTSITFTLTNNDAETATVVYRVSSAIADGESISLATGATSNNLVVSGLTEGDIVTIFATANATGQIKSNVAELEQGTTLATPTITQVSKTTDSITFTVRNESNTAASVTFGLSSPPTTTTLELAANTTSSNQTFTDLDDDTTFTVFAQATKAKYTNSAIASSSVTTDVEFDPSDLSPQLWLDAADASTITASSGSVSQWNNKGSLGNFTQGTGASQPTTGVTTLNGLNVIDFASDFLTAANQNEWKILHDGTKYEIFTVVKFGTTSDPNAIFLLMGSNRNQGIRRGMFIAYDDRVASSRNDRLLSNISTGVNSGQVVNNSSADDYITANTFHLLAWFADPGNATAADRHEVRLNNGTALKGNTETTTPSTDNPDSPLQIGSNGEGTLSMTGSIAEMIIISGANVTTGNRTDITNYLADKWGITI